MQVVGAAGMAQLDKNDKVVPLSEANLEGQVKSPTILCNQHASEEVKTENSDLTNYKKMSKIKVKGKQKSIRVIIALRDNTFWVADNDDKHLSLIDCEGNVLKESHEVTLEIWDAKQYKNEILITYASDNSIIKMSSDFQRKSVFSNLSPFFTRGLCVTSELNVLVCLSSSKDLSYKVVRLGNSGEIVQTIQYNNEGDPLYSNPQSVTSLPTGEIVVADSARGVVCVSRNGVHVFTWKGEVDGVRDEKFKAVYVTHDDSNNLYITDYDNDKVYTLQRQGTGARCLMDKSQGILEPLRIAVDITGNLLVGCRSGEIHVFEKL